jgi:hypothetical protein
MVDRCHAIRHVSGIDGRERGTLKMQIQIDDEPGERRGGDLLDRSVAFVVEKTAPPANQMRYDNDDDLVPRNSHHYRALVRHSRYGTLVTHVAASFEDLSARIAITLEQLAAANATVLAKHVGVAPVGGKRSVAYGWILHSLIVDSIWYDQTGTRTHD